MPTMDDTPSDPFGKDTTLHLLYQHWMDDFCTEFSVDSFPSHIEQYLMLLFLGEINVGTLSQQMNIVQFGDRSKNQLSSRNAVNKFKTDNKQLIEQSELIGEMWK